MKLTPFKDNLCSRYAEKMISIKVNNRCNCACSFCVDRGGYNAGETDVQKIVEKAIELSDYKTVIITGGEPFLDFDKVVEILARLRPHKTRLVLNTNGTLLTKSHVELLSRLLDELQISIHHWRENVNEKVFGKHQDLLAIKEALNIPHRFSVSINSTFNKFTVPSERKVFVSKMIDLCNILGADRLRLTELKKVDDEEFVSANDFFEDNSPVLSRSSNELITQGCTYYYSQNGVEVSVKRLCAFAKGKNAPAFSCCFINNEGQKKIDVDTEDTFKVIYSDGTTTNDWIFKGIK